ncbi:FAD-dependent oxidoreductase [Zhongshania aquimaris]
MGAGVVGLCTAHYLYKAGHAVLVLERRLGSGLETSFANAGMCTPSMSDP